MNFFNYLVNKSIVNSWLLHKKVIKQTIKLAQFWEHLAVKFSQSLVEIFKKSKNKGIVWNYILENIKKKDTNCNKSINSSYILTISTQIRLDGYHHRIKFEKFDAYAKYKDANFNHLLNALNTMCFFM